LSDALHVTQTVVIIGRVPSTCLLGKEITVTIAPLVQLPLTQKHVSDSNHKIPNDFVKQIRVNVLVRQKARSICTNIVIPVVGVNSTIMFLSRRNCT
jgi:hypothetical protein